MTEKKDENIDIHQEDMYNGEDVEMLDEELESNFELKLKKLREKLKECEKMKAEYLDGWQRSKAEFLNSKKANAEGLVSATARAGAKLIEEVIPILDSFDLAFSNLPDDIKLDHDWVKGISNIQSQLLSILENLGVTELDPVGETFDPFKHESIGVLPTTEKKKDNTVTEVFQKGYEYNGVVVRPAKVRVAEFKN